MTNYENIKSKHIDELAEWIDSYGNFEKSPWINWFDKNYCSKCEPEIAYLEYIGKECECAWCELHCDKCKYFKDLEATPDNKQMIKMWLESEAE